MVVRCEELRNQARALEMDLNAQRNKNEEITKQMNAMRAEMEERRRIGEVLKSDNEKLANELKAAVASSNNQQVTSATLMKELTTVVQ